MSAIVGRRPLRDVVEHKRGAGSDEFVLACGHSKVAARTRVTPKRSACYKCPRVDKKGRPIE